MVFVNTKRVAEKLEGYLIANGFNAQALSGDVPQNKRLRFMREFHSGELAVLIATDVASRGLHIPDVSHVFNYDLPQDAADYVHRIGRTARAGAEGDAISFGCEEYAVSLPDIEDYISHKIPVAAVTPELLARISSRRCTRSGIRKTARDPCAARWRRRWPWRPAPWWRLAAAAGRGGRAAVAVGSGGGHRARREAAAAGSIRIHQVRDASRRRDDRGVRAANPGCPSAARRTPSECPRHCAASSIRELSSTNRLRAGSNAEVSRLRRVQKRASSFGIAEFVRRD